MAARRLCGFLLSKNTLRQSVSNDLLRQKTVVYRIHSFTPFRTYSSAKVASQKEFVPIHLHLSTGETKTVQAKVGDNLLDVIIDNNLDISGFGACEGTLACSTCHLIFKKENYDSIPEKPADEELDMLDLAYGLTDTSRLGCQVIVTKDMKDWNIGVPAGVSDAREP